MIPRSGNPARRERMKPECRRPNRCLAATQRSGAATKPQSRANRRGAMNAEVSAPWPSLLIFAPLRLIPDDENVPRDERFFQIALRCAQTMIGDPLSEFVHPPQCPSSAGPATSGVAMQARLSRRLNGYGGRVIRISLGIRHSSFVIYNYWAL